MALKSLYHVCEIKKLDLIFNSVLEVKYKNSIVFRLARHLCSSTSIGRNAKSKNRYLFNGKMLSPLKKKVLK